MRLIRLNEVKYITGLGRSSIYKYMADNTFPASVSLGERAIAWQESEIQEWMSNKIEERTITTSREPIKPEKKAITESEVISFINDRFSQLDMSDAITWVMKVFRQ